MHQVNLDLSLEEISKIEGGAGLDLSIKNGQVDQVKFRITEYKRFYTQAIRQKPAAAAPALLARICGTCSNAHIMAATEAVETALHIQPTPQTVTLRRLLIDGLIVRDHALHLYIFALPDLFNQDSLLEFDENDPQQHQLLHDAFTVKEAGNQLSILVGGRSVHAPLPVIGGFLKFPDQNQIPQVINQLKQARPAVLRLIQTFLDCNFTLIHHIPYLATKHPTFSFIYGDIVSSDGSKIPPEKYRGQLKHVALPYSHASAYTYKNTPYMTGALARLNLNKQALHHSTQKDAAQALAVFPSNNIYHNNLAQAIEILHCLDDAVATLQTTAFSPEKPQPPSQTSGTGFGIIEAPRGILYHRLDIDNMIIKDAEILVPTGQNQLNIEADIKLLVNQKLQQLQPNTAADLDDKSKKQLSHDIEVLIRAYDPCMSCASHFLKINWQ
jgi:coenzyme F420-reducing hydrogenase alpha subunit